MKKVLTAICIVLILIGVMAIEAAAATSTVTFAWDAVTATDLAGYRLYQSTTPGVYNKATGKVCDVLKPTTTCTVAGVADGTYYWVATAYDTAGNESVYSNQISRTLDTNAPSAPGALKITVTITVEP